MNDIDCVALAVYDDVRFVIPVLNGNPLLSYIKKSILSKLPGVIDADTEYCNPACRFTEYCASAPPSSFLSSFVHVSQMPCTFVLAFERL